MLFENKVDEELKHKSLYNKKHKNICNSQNFHFFFFMRHPFLFLSIPSPSISLLSILFFYFPSVFIQYFSQFLSLPLSHFATSIPHHVLNCLSFLIAHPAPSFLSFHQIPVFSLLVPTSKSSHHFSFSYILSPQLLRHFLCHTPLIVPVIFGFFNSFPSFLLVCVFVPFTHLYIHPSPFCS
jgi:hypothetical protein